MKQKLVITGYSKLLIPLVIILLTVAFTLYVILPVYENFENKSNIDPKELDDIGNKLSSIQDVILKYQNKKDSDKESDKDSDNDSDNDNKKESDKDSAKDSKKESAKDSKKESKKETDKYSDKDSKKETDKYSDKDSKKEDLTEKKNKKLDPKDSLENLTKMLSLFKKKDNKQVKENFVSYTNTSEEILKKNWDKENTPSPLEVYNGSIKGYNCGEYDYYSLNFPESCLTSKVEYMYPPTHNKDHIFNPREHHQSNQIKYASHPHILHHEDDISQKILDYESTNVFNNYKSVSADVDRPTLKKLYK